MSGEPETRAGGEESEKEATLDVVFRRGSRLHRTERRSEHRTQYILTLIVFVKGQEYSPAGLSAWHFHSEAQSYVVSAVDSH